MAVAVKTPEPPPQRLLAVDPLAVYSVVGAFYILGSLAVVSYGIPRIWDTTIGPWLTSNLNSFINGFFLLMTVLAAAVGLVVLGLRMVSNNPPHGLRAGIFLVALTVLAILIVTLRIGAGIERAHWFGGNATAGAIVVAALGIGLVVLACWAWTRHQLENWLPVIEDQGWFTATPYKANLGRKVRRGTILGILILVGCGVYTLLSHESLKGQANWQLPIPFSGGMSLVFLPHVTFTVPLLLTLAGSWLAWRLVNFPVFGDFLIATEAELNKVSWTTGKRLRQDTIVVLVTVLLFTLFLFFVDLAWMQILSSRYVGVLQMPTDKQAAQKDDLKW